jgi:hypothetical protein
MAGFQRWLRKIDDHMQNHGMGYESAVSSGDGDEAIETFWRDLFRQGVSTEDAIERVFGEGYSQGEEE